MAQGCAICGKGPRAGRNVSHSNRKTSRVWNPNLQRTRTRIGGTVRRLRVCTRCIRSGRAPKVS
jgi:large subunit ribosomal protein L28